MSATRTQVYLTTLQREQLDALGKREGKTMAALVREAIDAYLDRRVVDPDPALTATFGADPDFCVPSREEWARRSA